MCAVKSQPGQPECPRTAQHRSYICWLATLRSMHYTRLMPQTTAISEPNFREIDTKLQNFSSRAPRAKRPGRTVRSPETAMSGPKSVRPNIIYKRNL